MLVQGNDYTKTAEFLKSFLLLVMRAERNLEPACLSLMAGESELRGP